jgi:hypothetical protein
MDGETALRYARTRHQDSDFGRIARQQQVIGAVRNAMLNPVNWPRIPAVVLAVQQSITTDVSPLDAIAVAAAMLRDPGEPDRLVIDTNLVNPVTGDGGAALLEARPELRSAVARFLGSSDGPTTASVEVLNGAGVAGLARTTADRLIERGFTIASIGDANSSQAQTAFGAAARRAADNVAPPWRAAVA